MRVVLSLVAPRCDRWTWTSCGAIRSFCGAANRRLAARLDGGRCLPWLLGGADGGAGTIGGGSSAAAWQTSGLLLLHRTLGGGGPIAALDIVVPV